MVAASYIQMTSIVIHSNPVLVLVFGLNDELDMENSYVIIIKSAVKDPFSTFI